MEFCLILTKYCVKTNSDGVIFQTLIEKIVKAQIGHDIPGVFFVPFTILEYKIDKQQTNSLITSQQTAKKYFYERLRGRNGNLK